MKLLGMILGLTVGFCALAVYLLAEASQSGAGHRSRMQMAAAARKEHQP